MLKIPTISVASALKHKQPERDELDRQLREFQERGGKIQHFAPGECGTQPEPPRPRSRRYTSKTP